MDQDNITVRVSGRAVYTAVKAYLDNSPEFQTHIRNTVSKLLDVIIANRINGMLYNMDRDIRQKIAVQLDATVRKEVELRLADQLAKGIKNLFEGKV